MDNQRSENHNVVKETSHPNNNSTDAQCVNTRGGSTAPNNGEKAANLLPMEKLVPPVAIGAVQHVQQNTGQPPIVPPTTNHDMKPPLPLSSLALAAQAQLNGEDVNQEEKIGVKEEESEASFKAISMKPKKDRSMLRKGKWTPEEEEYTSRIIHYFSSGVFTLPEGKTLRAYLAEKLNCDPMRITKKYAGASCLGKRVYQLCERALPSAAEVEMAKADLAQLEQRFRLRVEYGGIPLPPRNNFLAGAPNPFAQMQSLATATNSPAPGVLMGNPAGATLAPTGAQAPTAFPGSVFPLLAPNTLFPGAIPGLPMLPPNEQMNPLAALAWAQAAASLTPFLSQLAAVNLQKTQQELQKAFEDNMKSINQQSATGTVASTAPPAPKSMNVPPIRVDTAQLAPQPMGTAPADSTKAAANVKSNGGTFTQINSPRSKEDEDAGSMLMGFLSSLRKGYEEALSEREQIEGKATTSVSGQKRRASDSSQASKRPQIPAARPSATERAETESGTTSYPAESSLEDSDDAEKGKNSSSEDSDKDYSERDSSGERGSSSGDGGSVPPRKRMKDKHNGAEFTRKNVAEHNHRMDAMRSRSEPDASAVGPQWRRDEKAE